VRTYVGYELHLAIQTRGVRWSNGIDRITLEPEVPNVVTNLILVPAGSDRGRAIVPELLAAIDRGSPLKEVVWDPGYSLCQAETAHYPLQRAGVDVTFQPVTHQRGRRPFAGDAVLVDGQLFTQLLPDELIGLPMPPRGAIVAEKLEYERGLQPPSPLSLQSPRRTGGRRDDPMEVPILRGVPPVAGVPRTMRRSKVIPLVDVQAGTTCCCSGTLRVTPGQLPLWQRLSFGTTAWRISMSRRQAAESANSALKGSFADPGGRSSAYSAWQDHRPARLHSRQG
jgi:hypothetical protein